MSEIMAIGLDLAKNMFQAHSAEAAKSSPMIGCTELVGNFFKYGRSRASTQRKLAK